MNYIFESSIFSTGELGNGHGIISLRFGLISMAYNNISQCNSNYFSGYIIDTPKKPQMSLFRHFKGIQQLVMVSFDRIMAKMISFINAIY